MFYITPRISVVMATYNGAGYILEQIESILAQSLQPHEVIVCDDCSVDGTYEIVNEFIVRHQLSSWQLYRNEVNLGFSNNFYNAICKSTGDLVFLADQDDVWMENKIHDMAKAFDLNNDIKVLSCKNDLIDSRGEKARIWHKTTGECRKLCYNETFRKKPSVTKGCTMAFNYEIRNMLLKHGLFNASHDGAVVFLGLMLDSYYLIDRVGIYYRIHSSQTVGETSLKYFENDKVGNIRVENIDWIDCLEEVKRIAQTFYPNNKKFINSVENHMESMRLRVEALKRKSVCEVSSLSRQLN